MFLKEHDFSHIRTLYSAGTFHSSMSALDQIGFRDIVLNWCRADM